MTRFWTPPAVPTATTLRSISGAEALPMLRPVETVYVKPAAGHDCPVTVGPSISSAPETEVAHQPATGSVTVT